MDVAVVPEHQGEGLGAMVMDALMSWLRDNAPTDAYVQLIAEEGTTRFCEKYGFRVQTPEGSGMSFMTLYREFNPYKPQAPPAACATGAWAGLLRRSQG